MGKECKCGNGGCEHNAKEEKVISDERIREIGESFIEKLRETEIYKKFSSVTVPAAIEKIRRAGSNMAEVKKIVEKVNNEKNFYLLVIMKHMNIGDLYPELNDERCVGSLFPMITRISIDMFLDLTNPIVLEAEKIGCDLFSLEDNVHYKALVNHITNSSLGKYAEYYTEEYDRTLFELQVYYANVDPLQSDIALMRSEMKISVEKMREIVDKVRNFCKDFLSEKEKIVREHEEAKNVEN